MLINYFVNWKDLSKRQFFTLLQLLVHYHMSMIDFELLWKIIGTMLRFSDRKQSHRWCHSITPLFYSDVQMYLLCTFNPIVRNLRRQQPQSNKSQQRQRVTLAGSQCACRDYLSHLCDLIQLLIPFSYYETILLILLTVFVLYRKHVMFKALVETRSVAFFQPFCL